MRIREILKFGLIDYPGKIAAVVFVPGCNFKCPACHAKGILSGTDLIKEEELFKYLDESRQWMNGVVICGGEPTLDPDLPRFAARLKTAGLSVKLDTNGGLPDVLERLIKEGSVDYAALDVKGPPELLAAVTGVAAAPLEDLKRSISAVARFPGHEYRTTAAPVVRTDGTISFLTPDEAADTARFIKETAGGGTHKYYIQKFVPRSGGLLDARLERFPETTMALLEKMKTAAAKYLPECEIR